MKSFKNPFKLLTKFEYILWGVAVIIVSMSFLLAPDKDYLTLTASLIGVSALIFVAKGHVIGQALCVVFAVFYGIISFHFKYYGEMITYACMSAPMAIMSIVSWVRHPYKESSQVKVNKMTPPQCVLMWAVSATVTVAFYFILQTLGTANLIFSTVSVLTSFLACYLTFMRSPYYAVAYGANDVVLIILWVLAAIKDISYLPMILCFSMFLAMDTYGFICWKKMELAQKIKESL